MRAYLSEVLACVLAALVLGVAITFGGAVSIIAGASAAAFALSLRTLGLALLESMQPRTRHEKRAMNRITESIKSNMAQLREQQQQRHDASAGGGA